MLSETQTEAVQLNDAAGGEVTLADLTDRIEASRKTGACVLGHTIVTH